MRYIDEFRDQRLIKSLSRSIKQVTPEKPINIMEVCGTHTRSFFRFGLRALLPSNVRLVSGPGCPVCVSGQDYIDAAIAYARIENVIIASFGDMLNVPGTVSTLEKERGAGRDIRIVYSPWDALKIARAHPGKKIIFLAVGFETTAPAIALTILKAKENGIKNLFFFSSLKLIIPAMKSLLGDRRLKINGFLCPGHVSVVIGSNAYRPITQKYKVGCCIAGFEPLDMMEGMYFLIKQARDKKFSVKNQYSRAVKNNGNLEAKKIIAKVFRTAQERWRGLGAIPASGLEIRKEFSQFDARVKLPIKIKCSAKDPRITKCRCGDVLKGLIRPPQCPLFNKSCRPDEPFGPCMVSSEGTCNVYYQYH
ncbi:MAG: hydrogenase formation protein HypD [Candidatus Omnitrophica bacterium]|nr:hydrogenase formation protein HypD [Candidatus Omnitrophota bacterium]MDD5655020.1 hydrogenase formation protein HypD [Candidatus Omnitrophota bacterium]